MNHKIASRYAVLTGPLAAAVVMAAGCGDAFTLVGGTGGAGGTADAVSATSATSSATSSSAASSTSSGASMCDTSQGCPDQQFCMKANCAAGATGTCMPVAASHTLLEPVCGCDGITYWNSIYIGGTTRTAHKTGPCAEGDTPKPKACLADTCPGTARCAMMKSSCGSVMAGGTCWVLPTDCNMTSANELACDNLQVGNCENLCSLISGEKPFTLVSPMCNP